METSQTDNQLDIQYNKFGQVIVGVWFVALGLIATYAYLSAKGADRSKVFVFIALGLVFIVTGVIVMLTATRQHTTIQKPGPMTITNTKYFGGSSTVQTYNSQDIQSVNYYEWRIPTTLSSSSSSGSNIILAMKDGARIKVNSRRLYGIPFILPKGLPLREDAARIANFLGVPLIDGLQTPTNLSELTS